LLTEVHEFRYSAGQRWGTAVCALFFLGWVGLIVGVFLTQSGPTPTSWQTALGLALVPLAMLTLSAVHLVRMLGTVVVDDEGVEVRNGFGVQRRNFRDVERIEPARTYGHGLVLHPREGRPLTVSFEGLVEADVARRLIRERVPRLPSATERTEFVARVPASLKPMILGTSVFLLAVPVYRMWGQPDAWRALIVPVVVAALLVALALGGGNQSVRLTPEAVLVRNSLGAQSIPYGQVRRIVLSNSTGRGTAETITLVTMQRDMVFSSQYEHFTALRDALIARCPQATIEDSRPAGER
jgi:hypothetical protein